LKNLKFREQSGLRRRRGAVEYPFSALLATLVLKHMVALHHNLSNASAN